MNLNNLEKVVLSNTNTCSKESFQTMLESLLQLSKNRLEALKSSTSQPTATFNPCNLGTEPCLAADNTNDIKETSSKNQESQKKETTDLCPMEMQANLKAPFTLPEGFTAAPCCALSNSQGKVVCLLPLKTPCTAELHQNIRQLLGQDSDQLVASAKSSSTVLLGDTTDPPHQQFESLIKLEGLKIDHSSPGAVCLNLAAPVPALS